MKPHSKRREVTMYLLFGVIVTLANWITYSLLVVCTPASVTISNFIAWVVAVVIAFLTNKFFVFENKGNSPKIILLEALLFLGMRVATGIFEIFLPTLLIWLGLNQSLFEIDGFYAKLIVSIIVVVLNYILSKLVVFSKK